MNSLVEPAKQLRIDERELEAGGLAKLLCGLTEASAQS